MLYQEYSQRASMCIRKGITAGSSAAGREHLAYGRYRKALVMRWLPLFGKDLIRTADLKKFSGILPDCGSGVIPSVTTDHDCGITQRVAFIGPIKRIVILNP